jgi:hypothetical protein
MIVIYYIPTDEGRVLLEQASLEVFQDSEFSQAMKFIEEKRRDGCRFVSMSNEPNDMVGGFGVSSVVDGKLPNGEVYDLSKAERAGRVRASDRWEEPMSEEPLRLLAVYEAEVAIINSIIENEDATRSAEPTEHPTI